MRPAKTPPTDQELREFTVIREPNAKADAVTVESDDGDFLFAGESSEESTGTEAPGDTPEFDDFELEALAAEAAAEALEAESLAEEDAFELVAESPDATENSIPEPPPPPAPVQATTETPGNASARPPDLLSLLGAAQNRETARIEQPELPMLIADAPAPPPPPALLPPRTTPPAAEAPRAPRNIFEILRDDAKSRAPSVPPAPGSEAPTLEPPPPAPGAVSAPVSPRPPDILALMRAARAEADAATPPPPPQMQQVVAPVATPMAVAAPVPPPPAVIAAPVAPGPAAPAAVETPAVAEPATLKITRPVITAVPATPEIRHFPIAAPKPRRSVVRWLTGIGERGVRDTRISSAPRHEHLIARTRADERFSRVLTLSGAIIILPALILGWRYLVPDNKQMVDRLVADGRLKEAAVLANTMADSTKSGAGGPDYRFLATAMLVENAMTGDDAAKRLAFARTLEFARKNPADAFHASAAINAMRKLGVSAGATDYFAECCVAMPTHLITLWVEGLVDQHLAENRPGEALRVATIGWDAAPGQAVAPEYLLKLARMAGKPESIHSRIRQYVVVGGRFDKSDVYRDVARESGREEEALRTLWPFLMMRLQPTDYPGLTKSIMACGPNALAKETDALVEHALSQPDLPFESGSALIRLSLSRNRLAVANRLVDHMLNRGCESPEFLRLASDCRLWTNKPDQALDHIKRAYYRTGEESDFNRAMVLAKALESTRDIVALCEHRGLDKLALTDRPGYAAALTGLGEYETALRVHRSTGATDVETLRHIARLERALQRNEDALRTYGMLAKAEPENPVWRDQEFRLLVTLGRETEAIAAAERNWRDLKDPRYLGEALTAATLAEDNEATLRIAMEAEKAAHTADPIHLLDACYYLQLAKKNEPRVRILSALAERFPDRADIAMELVAYDYDMGRFESVENRFVKLPVLADNREGAAIRLSAKLALADDEGARRMLDDGLENHAEWLDSPNYAAVATQAAIQLRHFDAAETLTERFLDNKGGSLRQFRTLATRLLTVQGKAAEALPLYRSLDDDMAPELRLDYAWALSATGNFAEAESQMQRAINETARPDAKLYGALGDLRLSGGAAEKARESYRKALLLIERKR